MGKILKGKEQLTLGYGITGFKLDGKDYNHLGIDVVKQWYSLDTVIAYDSGTVTEIRTNVEGYDKTYQYGNYVIIKHDNGYQTWYAHLSRVDVKVGQKVKKGQTLGYMGATGLVTGAHLHFEVHKDGKRINPYDYVFGNKTFEKPKLLPLSNIVKLVLEGKYGNGEERKKKLIAEGYDYNKIQDEINKQYEKKDKLKVGDYVVPIKLVDVKGTSLIKWDNKYQIMKIDKDDAVLSAVRGTQRPIWAVLKLNNLRKVK